MTTDTNLPGKRTIWCKHHASPGPLRHECALHIDIQHLVTEQVGAEQFGRHFMLPCHTSTSENVGKARARSGALRHQRLPQLHGVAR